MFLIRYFEIIARMIVAVGLIKFVAGRKELAIHIANTAWYKYEILQMDIRTDRNRRRQRLVDAIAQIDAKPLEAMHPIVRRAWIWVRQLAVFFIADIDRRNAEEDASI